MPRVATLVYGRRPPGRAARLAEDAALARAIAASLRDLEGGSSPETKEAGPPARATAAPAAPAATPATPATPATTAPPATTATPATTAPAAPAATTAPPPSAETKEAGPAGAPLHSQAALDSLLAELSR